MRSQNRPSRSWLQRTVLIVSRFLNFPYETILKICSLERAKPIRMESNSFTSSTTIAPFLIFSLVFIFRGSTHWIRRLAKEYHLRHHYVGGILPLPLPLLLVFHNCYFISFYSTAFHNFFNTSFYHLIFVLKFFHNNFFLIFVQDFYIETDTLSS